MTTLADINQTLAVQNEMQEKTSKAIESLTKRFAAFLRVAKGDRLEDLESRREARRQSRAMGFAGRAKGAASVVKNNIGLISKILGGLALTAFVLQNEELRTAVMDFITTAGEGIATFFKSDEFREILGATFSAAGEIFTSLLGTVWETDGGKKMLIGLGVALAAIFGGPALIAAVAGALATAALRLPGQAIRAAVGVGRGLMVEKPGARAQALQQQKAAQRPVRVGPRAGSAGLDEARNLRNQQRAAVTRLNQANAAQQRFSTAQKLSAIKPQATLGQRIGNLAASAGRALINPRNLIRGGIVTEGAFQVLRPTTIADGTLVEGAQRVLESPELYSQGVIDEAIAIMEMENARMNVVRLDYERGQKGFEGTVESELYKPGALQGVEDFLQGQRNKPIGFENAAPIPFLGRLFGQNNTEMSGSVQSKIPALSQAMDGAGTGAPIVVPVPIPMDAGKGPGPVVSQGTTGGSLSAGETIHLNQDPATIIGGVPRQQSGGGGGW